jgi:hypothetical protein
MKFVATKWTALAVAAAFLTLVVPTFAGDAEIAKFLLKNGRQDLDKGKPNDALTKLEKARTEDPGLIEATFWIGAAHEQKKDATRALVEYRAFLTGLEAAMRAGSASKELLALEKRARTRIAALDSAGTEIAKSSAALAQELFSFASEQVGKDDSLAERALRALLRVVPDHAEASALLAKVTGQVSGEEDPLAAVKEWWNLISSRAFGVNDGWQYADGQIVVDPPAGPGKAIFGSAPLVTGPSFAYETEFTLDEVPVATKVPVAGLTFGTIKGSGYGVALVRERVVLQKVGRTGLAEIESVRVPEWQVGSRHKLVIVVERQRVRAYLDGKELIERRLTDRAHFAGEVGVIYENVRLRYHVLRFGNLGAAGVPVQTR